MPTGYTADISKGITFEQFILNCARAFGACISLRDEPGGGEAIPASFEASDYHPNAIVKERAIILELTGLTDEQCELRAQQAYDDALAFNAGERERMGQLLARYAAMKDQALAWVPPSSEHKRLKDFMLEQLDSSINFDCDTSYYDNNKPTRMTGAEWRADRISNAFSSIEYHTKGHADEIASTHNRNEWVRLLRESLRGEQQ